MRRISLKNCPYCGCSKIYVSSSATLWQKVSVLGLLRLIRCHVCMRRHFRPFFLPVAKLPPAETVLGKPTEVLSTRRKEKRTA